MEVFLFGVNGKKSCSLDFIFTTITIQWYVFISNLLIIKFENQIFSREKLLALIFSKSTNFKIKSQFIWCNFLVQVFILDVNG